MSIVNAVPLLEAAGGDYQISRSVRLRSSASAYLNRTFSGAPTSTTKQTFSFWLKRGSITSTARQTVFTGYDGSSTNNMWISIEPSDMLYVASGGTLAYDVSTTQVFRDPSAWYHFVIAFDTTQATASNRVKIYINGSQVTSLASSNYPPQNQALQFGLANANNKIGTWWQNTINFLDGYLTEVNFIDGQALTPSSFGQNDSVTGVWKPKKYAGTYGTNGFYLNFSDPSAATAAAIGKDYSGNGNNWTPNNISVTAGVTYDSMLDVPTMWADGGNGRGNYAVLNPLDFYVAGATPTNSVAPANGNLKVTANATSWSGYRSTIQVSSGKWYVEANCSAGTGTGANATLGVVNMATGANFEVLNSAGSSTDVLAVAIDLDTGSYTLYRNNTSVGSGSLSAGVLHAFYSRIGNGPNTDVNFGQRPFTYTPPTGFKALNTQNLPDSTIKKGGSAMNTVLVTGTGSNQSITGYSFAPDLVWIKKRSAIEDHKLFDTVRGAINRLSSNTTGAETTDNDLYGFTADGFDGSLDASATYAAWAWKKGATQGFDVVAYTGTGVATTVAHSLGVAPKMIIAKSRSSGTAGWPVYHASIGAANYLALNTTAASAAGAVWNSTTPTSSVFSVGATGNGINDSGATYVAYLFSEVAGFSKFGSYTGNGSADGTFVYCGFRPRFILVKRTDAAYNWFIFDSAVNQSNVAANFLQPNSSAAQGGTNGVDLLSNGFKWRDSSIEMNASGGTYIFAAFAENPFKNALAR